MDDDDLIIRTALDRRRQWWWRPYFALGRRQVRLGIWRKRRDRVCPEYRFVALEWQLWKQNTG